MPAADAAMRVAAVFLGAEVVGARYGLINARATAAKRVATAYLDALKAGDCAQAFALTSGMDRYETWCGDPQLLEYDNPVMYGPGHSGSDKSPVLFDPCRREGSR